MKEILTLLFDQTEKVAAWAGMVVLVVAITTLASCTENAANTKHKTLTMLIDKGYHSLVVNFIMEGWQNRTERLIVCMEAFDKYPGQKHDVQAELSKFE